MKNKFIKVSGLLISCLTLCLLLSVTSQISSPKTSEPSIHTDQIADWG
jgi:hypothetical protein